MAAALPVERRVLARLGWAGQTLDLLEHSLQLDTTRLIWSVNWQLKSKVQQAL
jgi:hypothetical protein